MEEIFFNSGKIFDKPKSSGLIKKLNSSSQNNRFFILLFIPVFEAGQRAYPVCHGQLAEKHHRGPQHEAVPADSAV